MVFVYLKLGFTITDKEFDKIYPKSVQQLSKKHWTPVEVAVKASKLLVTDSTTKVLDIGSGVGKFCLIGASITGAKFIGIEQRRHFVEMSRDLIKYYSIYNIGILNANIRSINFMDYNSFYLFNPFYENLESSAKIDSSVKLSPRLYDIYSEYVKKQLEHMPAGTRVVTYHGLESDIPISYELVSTDFDGKLKYWVKKKNTTEIDFFLMEKLIRHGVSKLKTFGFQNVNEYNIMEDEVYKLYFAKILKSKLGKMDFTDNVIVDLLKRIENEIK